MIADLSETVAEVRAPSAVDVDLLALLEANAAEECAVRGMTGGMLVLLGTSLLSVVCFGLLLLASSARVAS